MKKLIQTPIRIFTGTGFWLLLSCKSNTNIPTTEAINAINLKRGAVISCGPPGMELGSVDFKFPGGEKVKNDFNLAVKLLHSFEYDEAEKVFAGIIDAAPAFAMAYWGVAMSNFHPLWSPPTTEELKKGAAALAIAASITGKPEKEEAYINAVAAFYKDWDKTPHRTRCLQFEKAMEDLYTAYPGEKEAAIFYALSLTAAADPADKSFTKQKKAGSILNALYRAEPNHPGIVHYIIHTFDSPELAELALPAAKQYASVAPSSAHALHMPSHIFTRLGLWNESINSNLASIASAQCYAEAAGIKGHWDEEIHGLDYLVYAYLQKGENGLAKKQWDYLKSMKAISPFNFKVAYAYASIPARYLIENKLWKEAAGLTIQKDNFPLDNFPWEKAIVHFTRLLGAVHLNDRSAANIELKAMYDIHTKLTGLKDSYKANQVLIQIKASEAWIKLMEGKKEEALQLMHLAADMEDKTEKHPVTPGEVIPARELLGDMFLQMNKPGNALEAYELDLKKHPNRFNGLYGAARSAAASGQPGKAKSFYQQLLYSAGSPGSERTELEIAKLYLKN